MTQGVTPLPPRSRETLQAEWRTRRRNVVAAVVIVPVAMGVGIAIVMVIATANGLLRPEHRALGRVGSPGVAPAHRQPTSSRALRYLAAGEASRQSLDAA